MSDPAGTLATLKEIGKSQKYRKLLFRRRTDSTSFPRTICLLPWQPVPAIFTQPNFASDIFPDALEPHVPVSQPKQRNLSREQLLEITTCKSMLPLLLAFRVKGDKMCKALFLVYLGSSCGEKGYFIWYSYLLQLLFLWLTETPKQ